MIICDFETQTNHPILERISDLLLVNKRKRIYQVDFTVPVD